MAPTGWAPTRSSTCSCSGDGRGARWPTTSRASGCRTSPADAAEPVRAEIEGLRGSTGRESVPRIREQLADVMMDNVGVYRDETLLMAARDTRRRSSSARYAQGRRSTTRGPSSTPTCSRRASSATCSTAPRRRSSAPSLARRAAGAHAREDYPERDDANFLTAHAGHPRRRRAAPELQARDHHQFEPKPRTY